LGGEKSWGPARKVKVKKFLKVLNQDPLKLSDKNARKDRSRRPLVDKAGGSPGKMLAEEEGEFTAWGGGSLSDERCLRRQSITGKDWGGGKEDALITFLQKGGKEAVTAVGKKKRIYAMGRG